MESNLTTVQTTSATVTTEKPVTQTPRDLPDVLSRTRKIGLVNDEVVEIALATYVSKEFDRRTPLWLMLVANPSSNKTQLVSLFSKAKGVYRLDAMTSNPFVSGSSNKDNPQDLLPLLNSKCFIIKDYTTFFGRSDETVKQLLSDLVSIYDGEFAKHSSLRGTVRYQATFSHMGCITPMGLSSRQQYMNMVGARFLMLRIPSLTLDEEQACLEIAWKEGFYNLYDDASLATSEFADALCEGIRQHGIQLESISIPLRKKLNLLSALLAQARGEVKTKTQEFTNDDGDVVKYQEVEESQVEQPFRALHQLKTLCRALAVVRGKAEITEAELVAARRVVLSSMPVRRAEVLSAFDWKAQMTAKEASEYLGKEYRSVKRHLDDLTHLQILTSEKINNQYVYTPHPRFKEILIVES